MSKNKLARFEDNLSAENLFQFGKEGYENTAGNWNSLYFKNTNPITVELGCGKGEYTVGLARAFPERNFIGVDIKGARMWKGSQVALEEGLKNVAFLRTQIHLLHKHFVTGEISEIWITFPDPRPLKGDERKRLTSPRYLKMYKELSVEHALFHLKTDSTPFFDYTQEKLSEMGCQEEALTYDLYNSPFLEDHRSIQTFYEEMWLSQGLKIKYLRYRF